MMLFPFLPLIAVATSAVLLVVLYRFGSLGPAGLIVLGGWFAIAGYCQFFAASFTVQTAGLVLQTILAVYLILKWKVNAVI